MTTRPHLFYSTPATRDSYVQFRTQRALALLLSTEEMMRTKRRLGIGISVATAVALAALSVAMVVPLVERAGAQVAPISMPAVTNFTG